MGNGPHSIGLVSPFQGNVNQSFSRASRCDSNFLLACEEVGKELTTAACQSDATRQNLQSLLSTLNTGDAQKSELLNFLKDHTGISNDRLLRALASLIERYEPNQTDSFSDSHSPTQDENDVAAVQKALLSPDGCKFVSEKFNVKPDTLKDEAAPAISQGQKSMSSRSLKDVNQKVKTLDADSNLETFKNLENAINERKQQAREVKNNIRDQYPEVLKELNEIDVARSGVPSAIKLDPKKKVSFLVAGLKLRSKAQGIRKQFRTLVGEQIKNLPQIDDLPDIEKNINALEKPLKKNLEDLEKQIRQIDCDKENPAKLNVQKESVESRLKSIHTIKENIATIKSDHEYAMGFNRWADSKNLTLPITANFMGLRDQGGKEGSFVKLMRTSGNGSGNHALDRAMYIRSTMAGIMDQIQPGKYSRQFVKSLADELKSNSDEARPKLMKAFEESSDRDKDLAFNVASVAVMNLVATGFNPKTMQRDAPRLQYKIEEKGFSMTKRMAYIGQPGVTVRDPEKHIMPRLELLEGLQKNFRSILYPSNKPANVDPALTSKDSLLEFGSMMIASMPQDFLVSNENLVGELKKLCDECSDDGAQFSDLKTRFLMVHQEVSQQLKSFDSKEASEVAKVADERVIAVHRRGALRKAAAEVGRRFIVSLGRPAVSFTRTVMNLWKNASAIECFRKEMRSASATIAIVRLILAIESAVEAKRMTDEQGALIKKFLSGDIDKIDLRSFPKNSLNESSLQGIKKHAEDVWKKVNNNTPAPLDLVLLPVDTALVEGQSAEPEPAKNGKSPVVTRALVADSRQVSANIQPQQAGREIVLVSGNKQRCWLRAANASAVNFKDLNEVSTRVFDALDQARLEWSDARQKELKEKKILDSKYEPYWPKSKKEVEDIYQLLWGAPRFESNEGNEVKLLKMTLQLAIQKLIPPNETSLASFDVGDSDTIAQNILQLSKGGLVQSDRQIMTAFLKAIGFDATVVSGSTKKEHLQEALAAKEKIVIRHTGASVNSGHFDFYSKAS